MKKFLIAIILLIPVIVIVALSATGTIIARATPVNARELILKNSDNQEITSDTVFRISLEDTGNYIIVNVLPSITYDDSIIYRLGNGIDDPGQIRLERQGNSNRYSLIPVKSGVVRVIISPANNSNISKAFTVIVLDDNIKCLNIYDESGNNVNFVKLLKPERLYRDIYPPEALDVPTAMWSSSNDAIVKVSPNGTLTPVSRGKTYIHFSAKDKAGNEFTSSVMVDASEALVNTVSAYSAQTTDAAWIRDNIAVFEGAAVTGGQDGVYTVSDGKNSAEVRVSSCQGDAIGFNDCPDTLYTNNGVYCLKAGYLDTKRQDQPLNIVYYVNDSTIARVYDGVIMPLSAGNVTVTASYYGGEISKVFTVRDKPAAFNLFMNEEDSQLGIMQDRVFARYWYNGNMELTDEFQFGIQGYNGDFDVCWDVNDPAAAQISQYGRIKFSEASLGKEVTVTAYVCAYGYRTKVKRSFTFKIKNETAVNVYKDAELFTAADTPGMALVLQNNIEVHSGISPTGSVYGNGFMLDASKWEGMTGRDHIIMLDHNRITDAEKTMIIEDVCIEAADKFENTKNRGSGIRIEKVQAPIIIKNVILQLLECGIYVHDAKNLTVEGSIIGDCFFTGINGANDPPAEHIMILRNNIFKTTGGPSVMLAIYSFNSEFYNKNPLPYVRIEGFMDIYNWKTVQEVRGLLNGIDRSLFDSLKDFLKPENLIETVGDILTSLFEREDMAYLTYKDPLTGEKYISLGVFALGFMNTPDPSRIKLEDEGLKILKLEIPCNDGSDTGFLMGLINNLTQIYMNMSVTSPCYIVSYDFGDGEPRNKPGDPIPQSLEIFNKLKSYY